MMVFALVFWLVVLYLVWTWGAVIGRRVGRAEGHQAGMDEAVGQMASW